MPTHPYLDLQQGNVESYCMMVPNKAVQRMCRNSCANTAVFRRTAARRDRHTKAEALRII